MNEKRQVSIMQIIGGASFIYMGFVPDGIDYIFRVLALSIGLLLLYCGVNLWVLNDDKVIKR